MYTKNKCKVINNDCRRGYLPRLWFEGMTPDFAGSSGSGWKLGGREQPI